MKGSYSIGSKLLLAAIYIFLFQTKKEPKCLIHLAVTALVDKKGAAASWDIFTLVAMYSPTSQQLCSITVQHMWPLKVAQFKGSSHSARCRKKGT